MGQMKTFSEFISERVVSVVQRKKQARRMAKMARSSAFQAKKKKAMLRMRSPAKLAQVARKTAIQSYRDKFYPTYNDMSLQQKVKIDQLIMAKYGSKIGIDTEPTTPMIITVSNFALLSANLW